MSSSDEANFEYTLMEKNNPVGNFFGERNLMDNGSHRQTFDVGGLALQETLGVGQHE